MYHHNENSTGGDPEVAFIARALIAQHGARAARAAADHLNAMIDLGDLHRRDMWARVVHEIHEQQGRGRPQGLEQEGREQRSRERGDAGPAAQIGRAHRRWALVAAGETRQAAPRPTADG